MKHVSDYQEALDPNGHRTLYQPIEHPAFQDWKAQQPCQERWDLIQSVDLPPTGLCVDIGCHTGWFCRQFSRQGWEAVGIDTKQIEIEIARDIMGSFSDASFPKYIHGDIIDVAIPPADVVLCLSVAMYWFNPKFGKTHEQAWAIMQKISHASIRMFLDYGGMYSTLSESFPEDIITNTTYTNYELLGHTELESRPFYIFTRN